MNGVEFQAGNLSDFDDSRRQGEFGRDSMERMGARVTTQTKFNRGLHAGITQDRDLSRGRWANPPRRFESSLFAAAYPWIRGFSENHAQTPFTISPLDFEYRGWILPIIIPPLDSCASLLHFHPTIVGWTRYVLLSLAV